VSARQEQNVARQPCCEPFAAFRALGDPASWRGGTRGRRRTGCAFVRSLGTLVGPNVSEMVAEARNCLNLLLVEQSFGRIVVRAFCPIQNHFADICKAIKESLPEGGTLPFPCDRWKAGIRLKEVMGLWKHCTRNELGVTPRHVVPERARRQPAAALRRKLLDGSNSNVEEKG
jgi:hypothetical protein